jgi:hypothetical protein
MQVKVEIKGKTKEFNIKISKSNEIKDLKRHIFEKKVLKYFNYFFIFISKFALDPETAKLICDNSVAMIKSRIIENTVKIGKLIEETIKIVILFF